MIGRDGVAGLAVCTASLALFWFTLDLQENPLVPIGPGFYPRIVLALTAALGLALAVPDLLARRKPSASVPQPGLRPDFAAVAVQFAVFALYVIVMSPLGFRLSTILYVAAANAILDPPRRPVQWLRVLALALATALATWFVFEHYLSVLMPRGRWTDF